MNAKRFPGFLCLLGLVAMLSGTGSFAASYQIWPSTAVPSTPDAGAGGGVELGVSFKSDISGYITGIRFYKSAANTGMHVGNLWSSTGALLATASFTNETSSGWQQVNFSNPVAITANAVYVASYHSTIGHWSVDYNYFAAAGVDNAPLHALANASGTPDGRFAWGSTSAFPASGVGANYWVDVAFTPAASSTSIWPSTAVPSTPDAGAGGGVELGVSFKSDISGYITGIRFYKSAANTGTHVGNLWSSTGALLATASFTNETSSGWQQVNFSNPVAITANAVYVASYHSTIGHWSVDYNYFAAAGVDNAPLHALANASGTPDGRFAWGSTSAFPTSGLAANYWVDVAFTTSVGSVAAAPAITGQPGSVTVVAGQTASFSVAASGASLLSYQWRRNGTAISGATSSSYTTPVTTTSDSGAQFTVVVSNSAGTATSNTATLTVNAAAVAPAITTQPANQTVTAGQTATFSVAASGTAPLSYQWQKNGTAISGATFPSYTTPATATSDSGSTFRVVMTNIAGSATSSSATLTVNAAAVAPAITTQPSNQTVTAGQAATFSVIATGTAPLSYQWQKNGTAISGATSSSYTTPATATSDSGSTFRAVVTNGAGTATSNAATLMVNAQSTGGTPTCGKVGDSSNYVPGDWGTFVPPAKGQSYVDPTFGCTVTRVTDASQDDWNGSVYLPITHGYSTVSPFNANDTYLLLSDGWGRRYVTDLKGNSTVPISNMPTGFNDGWFLWDATNPAVFYYTSGNSLMKGTISGSSVATATVHQFSEYAAINFMDETDVSQDGAHVVVIGGDNSGSSAENVFVYNFVANTKGPVYTTSCVGVINNVSNGCLHKMIQTPDNNIAMDFASDGSGPEQGLRLWTGSTPLPHLQDMTDHMDTGYDLNGNAVYIESGNSYYTSGITNPCPSGWGLDVRQIYNTQSSVCLLDNLPSWHVGYRGNANQPWVVLSFDDQQTRPSPEWFDNNGSYATPTSSNWRVYDDEVMAIRIDANNNSSKIYRLARGYSRTDEDFNAQLKGAISRSGKYVAFDSNMAYAHSGCPANFQTPTNCSDVYVIKVQ